MNLRPGFQFLLLTALALGVYYPTLFAPLNYLDDQLLVHQLLNQEGFSLSRHFSPGGTYDYYRPLLTLTFEVDKYVGGLQETFMHLVNVLLHAINVLLIFLLARRFGCLTGNAGPMLPFLAGAVFCLHPINTEAVNWIAGRTDVLAGMFVFTSLLCLLHAMERHSLFWGGAGAMAFLGGALCKETALFLLPGVFFLLIWRPETSRPIWPARWGIFGFYWISAGGYFVLRWGAFHTDRGLTHTAKFLAQTVNPTVSEAASGASSPFLEGSITLLKASGFYATKLLQPFPLNFAIDRVDGFFLLPGLALIAWLMWLAWRRRPLDVFFLISAFLGSSALLVIFTRLAWTPIAERYLYIPCGIFAVAVMFGWSRWGMRLRLSKTALPLVPVLLAASAWGTVSRNLVWQDNLTLYQDTVRKSPDFGPARNNLALALYAHGRPEEAAELLATTQVPDSQRSSLNRAAALARQGLYEEARRLLLERAEKHDQMEAHALEMLVSLTFREAGKMPDGEDKQRYFKDIAAWLTRLQPLSRNPFHWYRLGRIHLFLENQAEARRCFAEAARRLPEGSPYKEPAANLARNLAP